MWLARPFFDVLSRLRCSRAARLLSTFSDLRVLTRTCAGTNIREGRGRRKNRNGAHAIRVELQDGGTGKNILYSCLSDRRPGTLTRHGHGERTTSPPVLSHLLPDLSSRLFHHLSFQILAGHTKGSEGERPPSSVRFHRGTQRPTLDKDCSGRRLAGYGIRSLLIER